MGPTLAPGSLRLTSPCPSWRVLPATHPRLWSLPEAWPSLGVPRRDVPLGPVEGTTARPPPQTLARPASPRGMGWAGVSLRCLAEEKSWPPSAAPVLRTQWPPQPLGTPSGGRPPRGSAGGANSIMAHYRNGFAARTPAAGLDITEGYISPRKGLPVTQRSGGHWAGRLPAERHAGQGETRAPGHH